jgi:transposase
VRTVRRVGKREAHLTLSTLPGEQGQVDWASFGTIRIGRATRRVSCFVLVLSWSRGTFARFYLDQTMESFVRGHVEGFEALGGVPRGILYDNLKSAVLERVGNHIRFPAHAATRGSLSVYAVGVSVLVPAGLQAPAPIYSTMGCEIQVSQACVP